jgi:hypothetical protein
LVVASLVTTTASPPAAGTVATSRRPELGGMNQKATRRPLGDHAGCIASWSVRTRFAPVSTLTTRSVLALVFLVAGRSWPASLKATSLPSGDHAGWKPVSERRRTFSPVAPMT